ncbi:aryl-sulfate sulfotransferase [Arenibacter algicola]|uniref:aryl-sulfate sulfotransferase n=1 Tax=Arenibacter algicola TaxID=616991 RepID=UPI001C06E8E4|nr:aryl-sulfate sulfotransferase [Arenibacter algicola]MBU2903335.1 aryl-sulfate sulfotransferase [Arenibacter algicola]
MFKLIGSILISLFFLFIMGCSNEEPTNTNTPEPDPVTAIDTIKIPDNNTLGTITYSSEVYPGYTLFTIHKDTYLINNCGQVINHWISDYDRGGAYYLLEDGSLLRAGKYDNPDITYGGLGGIIEKFDWNGDKTWQYIYSTPLHSQHHGLYPMENGNILLLAATRKTYEEAIVAGRDPQYITEGELYNEQVIEIEPQGINGGNIVWEWNAWDHLIQDLDNTKENFGSISLNPQLININFLGISTGEKDWLHFNSLQFNESLDQIILSSQKLNEIYIIDHSTSKEEAATNNGGRMGKGGDILYRWGNPIAYNQGSEMNQLLFGQHNVQWIDKGLKDQDKIILFNNGTGRNPNHSSIDIITPPVDSFGNYIYDEESSFGPIQPEWSYKAPNKGDFFSKILSSVQRLPNGNTLICEGTKGKFFEINPNNEIVWEYINPETNSGEILHQGEEPISNVFMALKYSENFPGFSNKNIAPGDPIELNFNIGNCSQ